MDNVSIVMIFTLSGLEETTQYRVVLFFFILLCYCVILLANVTLISTIISDRNLHQPMYIFLCSLCLNGLYGTAGLYPKLLIDILSESHIISYAACFLQAFVTHSFTGADISILALMSYDRYVAICQPLVYQLIMTKVRIIILTIVCWLMPCFCMFVNTLSLITSKLCGSHINKIYCVNAMISKLTCTLSTANIIIVYFNIAFYLGHVVFILWTYMHIVRSSVKSINGRKKYIQTCLPHVICLVTYLVTLLFDLLYMRIGSKTLSQHIKNFMSIAYIIFPPIINPIIYGLNLTKVRNKIFGLVHDEG